MASEQPYRADPAILSLGEDFYDAVDPANYPKTIERFFNHRHAAKVGLGKLDETEREQHFGRFEPLPGNLEKPLALRYHGHQFRHYNPELGDGRGFLFGQLRDDKDRLLDLGTKGSGQTPWSRRGDGRLTLKGGVREILATEMLEALGVNTSKTFALYETGEQLWRGDEPSPTRSSVMTRLSHGHIRIGSFQRLAFYQDRDNLSRLVDYCLDQLYGETLEGDTQARALRLFDLVASTTAELAASYMVAGFVHGVLNSDNIAITGESFDYGPWRFTPKWEEGFTAAYFDEMGLYSFGRQPEAIHWDLVQLGSSLTLIGEIEDLQPIANRWTDRFDAALIEKLLQRLGVAPGEDDRELAQSIVTALGTNDVLIDRFFFDWRGGIDPGGDIYAGEDFRKLATLLEGRANKDARSHPYWSDTAPCSMHIEEVESIWDAIAENDDWQPLYDKIDAIRRMGEAMGA
ncbi:protein adenylyltransferase SelO family protein [Sphingomicrobium marinum]|uniref:protein adenylyltransferase SelO family protein n=1 Tax=Sphingomicrobium marinum TaxID=1227950 RepID=UPI00223F236F|nr:YdiU family protein [Sphingomicrobium marinum]